MSYARYVARLLTALLIIISASGGRARALIIDYSLLMSARGGGDVALRRADVMFVAVRCARAMRAFT